MQTTEYLENPGAALATLMSDFAHALAAEPDALIPAFSDEPDPDDIELIFHPEPGMPIAPGVGPGGRHEPGAAVGLAGDARPGLLPIVPRGAAAGAVATPGRELPANFRCTLCEDRMYPVRNFQRAGRRPVLVLYHSGSYGRGPARLDRSREFIFGSAEEDELFGRMLGAVQLELGELHYQEYPACHFNAVRSTADDWRDRGAHCMSHLHDTVEREKIRLLILTGPAAVILLGEGRARELSASCAQAQVSVGASGDEREIPALVMRSPAALLALEQKRRRLKAAGDEDGYREAVDEEKAVKNQVLAALKAAMSASLGDQT
jgi:hypothetical protein